MKFRSMTVIAAQAIVLIVSAASADAYSNAGDLQPYSCGQSRSVVVTTDQPSVGINHTNKAIRMDNVDANCGYVLLNLPEQNLLVDSTFLGDKENAFRPHAMAIYFLGTPNQAKNITVRMCFKPQLGTSDLITIDKRLSESVAATAPLK